MTAEYPLTNGMIVDMLRALQSQLAQALSDKSLAQEQSEQDTRRRLEAEEEAAYFRQMNERLIAQLESQAAEIEQLKAAQPWKKPRTEEVGGKIYLFPD